MDINITKKSTPIESASKVLGDMEHGKKKQKQKNE